MFSLTYYNSLTVSLSSLQLVNAECKRSSRYLFEVVDVTQLKINPSLLALQTKGSNHLAMKLVFIQFC